MPHYCKICEEYKSNESFSGRGHAAHICKKCAKLPAEVRDEIMTINRIMELPFRLSKAQRNWLEKMKADPRSKVKEAAEYKWNLRFVPRQRPDVDKEGDEPFDWDDNPEYAWLLDEGIAPDPDWVSPEDEDFEQPF